MSATAENLRDLHELHQRAKALRDRLSSGPKTLAVRQTTLATRMAQVEHERKALQDAKVQLKKQEHSLQGIETKIDDLKTKLNLVKKNDEYKALQNQIAHEAAAKSKVEEEILVSSKTSKPAPPRSEARSRSEAVQRRGHRAPAADRKRSQLAQGPARGTRDGDRSGRGRDPRGISRAVPPHRGPLRRRCAGRVRVRARAWAVSPR